MSNSVRKAQRMSPIFDAPTKKFNPNNFQTPPVVCNYMASLVPDGVKTILEPTPGIGNLVRALSKKGFEVTAPDDFFTLPPAKYDCIVMNPPFSSRYANMQNAPAVYNKAGMRLGYEIMKQCMMMSNIVIALMPWFTISDSDVRLRSLKRYGIRSITSLPRSTFQYARIQTIVIEMEKGFSGNTEFKVMDTFSDTLQTQIIL